MYLKSDELKDTQFKYNLKNYARYNEDNYDILSSVFVEKLFDIPEVGEYTIKKEDKFRLDKLSYKIMQSFDYELLLLLYNAITKLDELDERVSLSYFSTSSLENLDLELELMKNKYEIPYNGEDI